MDITLLHHTPQTVAEKAATMCYRAKDGHKALVSALKSGHESLIEHINFTFLIEDMSRVTLAQLTRHRLASYSVESQRYCGVDTDDLDIVRPESFRERHYVGSVDYLLMQCAELYDSMVKDGIPKEDARYILPQGIMTRLVLTMNARELRHFFALRCCNRAQTEIRELADEMLRLCRKAMPDVFDDAGAPCVSGECPEGVRSCGKNRAG